MLGQLPADRFTPVLMYRSQLRCPCAGQAGTVWKPTFVKAYISIFVSFSVKAVHLEIVSDLIMESFLAALCQFIAPRSNPSSGHETNFTGAARELKELFEFLHDQLTQCVISEFCSTQNIQWKFIPERAPNFGCQ